MNNNDLMSNNGLKQDEFENYLQRFMQIREQIHDEIKKIGMHTATLDATNKRFVAHFDVFEKLSKKSEEQVHAAIKAAAYSLNQEAVKSFTPLIEEILRQQIVRLDHSVLKAQNILSQACQDREIWPFRWRLTFCCFLLAVGFGVGSFLSQPSPPLPEKFTQDLDRFSQHVNALSKVIPQGS